jgi:uncharacterized protein
MMLPQIRGLRPVVSADEVSFGKLINQVLSPSRPLKTQKFLKGRDKQIEGIKQALYAPGRHAFIHGFRGVGKTSLALTSANLLTHDKKPLVLGCSEGLTFGQFIRDMVEEGLQADPSVFSTVNESDVGIGVAGFRETIERGKIPIPETLNEAVRLTKYLVNVYSPKPIIVVDEFDRLTDKKEQQKFADFIKLVGDQDISVCFIFCGIGDSIDDLLKAHRSAHRYIHPVNLGRLPWEARMEIVDSASETLGIDMDKNTKIRICMISDGFPHYIHLITEKLFWLVFRSQNGGKVTYDLFDQAIQEACDSMEPELKIPYECATRKYSNDIEEILFAVADGHELQRPSREIRQSYERIMKSLCKEPLTQAQYNSRMNRLKKPEYGEILVGNRQGWYEFKEKVIRGYARLRAERKGVELEVDHPARATNFKPTLTY